MNDCARILPLLDVYLDDETTAETNVLVQEHVEQCETCSRQLQTAHHLRVSMRDALGHDRAPASLHHRVHDRLTAEPRPRLAALIRQWIVPAAATMLIAWIVLPSPPAEPGIYRQIAVGEHVACALERATRAHVPYYPAHTSMPLIPLAGGRVRIVEAHACGQQIDNLLHMILEEDGTKASIFIMRAGEGPERVFRPQRSGDFEVNEVRTTRHRAFVVIDRAHARALRSWREPTVQRLQHFLKQVEGT